MIWSEVVNEYGRPLVSFVSLASVV